MARFNTIKNSFIAGEVSPEAEGRTDLPQYPHSCKLMQNFRPLPAGGARKRVGSRYCASTIENELGVLFPFISKVGDAYIISAKSSGLYALSPAALSETTISGPSFFGSGHYQLLTTSYTDALYTIGCQYTQSVDTLFIFCGAFPITLLSETAPATFSWTKIDDATGFVPPWMADNADTGSTITASATTGSVTLTASKSIFDALHVGAYFRINVGSTFGYARITAVASATSATATVIVALGGTTATDNWAEGSWSDYRGYPTVGCFFQDRLIVGGSPSEPDTFWASGTGAYYNFDQTNAGVTLTDESPYSDFIIQRQLNDMRWMASSSSLQIGTAGSEWSNGSFDPPIGPNNDSANSQNYQARSLSTTGSSYVQAVQVLNTILFVGRSGKEVWEYAYDFYSQGYKPQSLSIYASHLPGFGFDSTKSIYRAAWQQSTKTLWCVDGAGNLFAVTRDKDTNLLAWHRVVLGGSYIGSGGTGRDSTLYRTGVTYNPIVNDVAVIPSVDGRWDDVYVNVTRTINGSIKTYLERIGQDYPYQTLIPVEEFSVFSDEYAPWMMDSADRVDMGSAVTAITGFDHLEGETVQVIADGLYIGTKTVSSGGFTLSTAAQIIIAGLPYEAILKTQRIDAGSVVGSAQGETIRVDKMTARVSNTGWIEMGSSTSDLEGVSFLPAGSSSDTPVPFFTGDVKIDMPSTYDEEAYAVVRSNLPYPCTVVALMLRGVVYEP